MRFPTALLITIACLGSGVVIVSGGCTMEELQMCLHGTDFEKALTSGHHEMFTHSTAADFRRACRDFDEVDKCLEPIIASCPEQAGLMFTGISDGVSYLCGEGSEAYLRNMKCFEKPTLKTKLKQCAERMEVEKHKMMVMTSGDATSLDDIRVTVCRMITDFLSCVNISLLSECNQEAARLVETIIGKMFGPYERFLQCVPQEKSSSDNKDHLGAVTTDKSSDLSGNVFLGICVGLAVLCLIGAVWYILRSKYKISFFGLGQEGYKQFPETKDNP